MNKFCINYRSNINKIYCHAILYCSSSHIQEFVICLENLLLCFSISSFRLKMSSLINNQKCNWNYLPENDPHTPRPKVTHLRKRKADFTSTVGHRLGPSGLVLHYRVYPKVLSDKLYDILIASKSCVLIYR